MRRLDAELAARERTMAGGLTTPMPVALDSEARKRLAALGYVSADGSREPTHAGPLRDIKDMLPVKHLATLLRRQMADRHASPEDIERTLRELARRSPETASFHSHLGSLLVSQGRLDEAASALDAALHLDPDLPEALVAMGNLRLRQDKRAEAMAFYRRALEREPDLPEAHLGLGNVLAETEDVAGALTEYRAVLRLQPDHADAHYDLGNVLARTSALAEAAEQYGLALAADPDHTLARFNLAHVREQQGMAKEAISQYRELLRREPRFVDASNALALLLMAQDDLESARRELVAALRTHPRSARTSHNLATVLSRQHRIPKAMAYESRAVELEPDHPEYLNGMAWLLATAASARRRDGGRAVALAERACALTARKDARFLNTLAAGYASTNRPADAARIAREAARVARASGQTSLAEETEAVARLYEDAGK